MNWWVGEIVGDFLGLLFFIGLACLIALLVIKGLDLFDDIRAEHRDHEGE